MKRTPEISWYRWSQIEWRRAKGLIFVSRVDKHEANAIFWVEVPIDPRIQSSERGSHVYNG